VKGNGGRTGPGDRRNGFGSAQIAFTKGGHGVSVRPVTGKLAAPAGHIAPHDSFVNGTPRRTDVSVTGGIEEGITPGARSGPHERDRFAPAIDLASLDESDATPQWDGWRNTHG
jgi:hypothetical protein